METLLDRGADGDMAEAEAAIERLADAPADDGLVMRDIWLLRLRALLARAHGDDAAYARLQGSLPRHGDIAWLRRAYRRGPRRCHDSGRQAGPSPIVLKWTSSESLESLSRLARLERACVAHPLAAGPPSGVVTFFEFRRLRYRPSAVEALDTYSHLWPDSEDRTRDAIDSVLGFTADPTADR